MADSNTKKDYDLPLPDSGRDPVVHLVVHGATLGTPVNVPAVVSGVSAGVQQQKDALLGSKASVEKEKLTYERMQLLKPDGSPFVITGEEEEEANGATTEEEAIANFLAKLHPSSQELLTSLKDLMVRNFGASETDNQKITGKAIADQSMIVYVAKNKSNKPVAFCSGSLLSLRDLDYEVKYFKDKNGKYQERAFMGMWYIANEEGTDSNAVLEMVKEMQKEAAKAAKDQGKTLIGGLTEAMHAEKFFSEFGMRRMYVKTAIDPQTGKCTYAELPYFQPPVQFDVHGRGIKQEIRDLDEDVAYEKYETPEHLMFVPSGQKWEVSQEEVMGMIYAMFQYNSLENVPENPKDDCEDNMRVTVSEYEEEFLAAMNKSVDGGKVYLLGREDRLMLSKVTGAEFVHHRAERDEEEKFEMNMQGLARKLFPKIMQNETKIARAIRGLAKDRERHLAMLKELTFTKGRNDLVTFGLLEAIVHSEESKDTLFQETRDAIFTEFDAAKEALGALAAVETES